MSVWIAILIALLPAFVLFLYVARLRKDLWVMFTLGAVGWTTALFARLPILNMINNMNSTILILTISSLLAGIFEEGIRYLMIYGTRKIKSFRFDWKYILVFGLGWGFCEALILYAASIISIVYIQGSNVSFFDALPGAVERNTSVIFHVSATFIVYKAVISIVKKRAAFIAVAIALHSTFNLFAVELAYVLRLSVWYLEISLLAMSILIALFSYTLVKLELVSNYDLYFFKL